MPKSRVRSKAVYTPPPKRSASKKVSPRWLVPAMLACLLLGLAWIAVFYVTQGSLPIGALARLEPGGRIRVHHRWRGAVHQVAVVLTRRGAAKPCSLRVSDRGGRGLRG